MIPTNYPLRKVMLTAQRFDKSGRSRNDYESLTAFIERWARNQMRPYATCDECGAQMHKEFPAADQWPGLSASIQRAFRQLLFVLPCAENWMAEGDAGLPRITGLKYYHNHDERWERQGKHKLPALMPSGGVRKVMQS